MKVIVRGEDERADVNEHKNNYESPLETPDGACPRCECTCEAFLVVLETHALSTTYIQQCTDRAIIYMPG
jgi:hypothetical protein